MVDYAWVGRDDVHVELAPEPFLHYFHMEQTKETAPEAIPKGDGTFGLINKGRIVDLQFAHRGLQMFEISGVDLIYPAENHRMNFLKSRQRFEGGIPAASQRVSNLDLRGRLNVRDEV